MELSKMLPLMGQILPRFEKGAFLSVMARDLFNMMTIGWGMTGICWRKPILMVAVRDSRHTFTFMEKASDFTVTMPSKDLRDELFYCGSKSGRDVDKLMECGLKTVPAQKTETPIIDTEGLCIECKIVYKRAMDPDFLTPDYHELYPEKDYHTLYYGEILACYER